MFASFSKVSRRSSDDDGSFPGDAIMGWTIYLKDLFILSSILGLFVIGFVVALKSGVVSMGRGRGRQIWDNASHLVVALAGCLAFLLMVQQMIGLKIGSPW